MLPRVRETKGAVRKRIQGTQKMAIDIRFSFLKIIVDQEASSGERVLLA